MTDDLAARIASLRDRAVAPGLDPVPWLAVTANVESLRARRGENWATLGLAVDGWITAAEDEWSEEVVGAVEHLGWADEWNPRSPRFLIHTVTGHEAQGFVNGVKGTVFEQLVAKRSEAGDIELPNGADSLKLAADLQQPGWDAQLLDAGEVVGVVQMKATDRLGYLEEHFARYPDISDVIATSEVAQAAAEHGLSVIDGGITNDALETALGTAVDSLDAASLLHEVLPVVGLGALAVRAVNARRAGASVEEIGRLVKEEGVTLVAVNALGLAVETMSGTVILRPVTTTAVRLGMHRARSQRAAQLRLEAQAAALAHLQDRADRVP